MNIPVIAVYKGTYSYNYLGQYLPVILHLCSRGAKMDIVIDTSALIAVIVNEPERNKIIERLLP